MKSYSTQVRQAIQLHVLDHYDERGARGLLEDFNAVRTNRDTDESASRRLVEDGNFLIWYDDQRNYLNGLGINDTKKEYSDDEVFNKYVALLAREILNIIKKYR
jgi:hypothetical protein